ncbi:protein C19orf12-like [Sitodiplosis mosellana]|uniref:protein C19orf12-like n=1 Tax=Sitodiplosis mosellana TaxID=263140 RepID=UPI0024445C07|nr:protein C19orf12-like [Sitodiplosis mosellana]
MAGMDNLKKTAQKGLLGGVICGATAFVGALVGGPIGLGIGSAVGGAISAHLLRFRSAPDVVLNDFTPNERTDLLERARRAAVDTKEAVIKMLLQIISALLKCRSKEELIDRVLLPILKQLAEIGITSLLRYITGA